MSIINLKNTEVFAEVEDWIVDVGHIRIMLPEVEDWIVDVGNTSSVLMRI